MAAATDNQRFYAALAAGDADTASAMLAAGQVSIEERAENYYHYVTPLVYVASLLRDSADLAAMLVDLGADVGATDEQGRYVWCRICVSRGRRKRETYVISVHVLRRSCRTALHYAAQLNNAEVVDVLLDAGADPNATDDQGDTVGASRSFDDVVSCSGWRAAPPFLVCTLAIEYQTLPSQRARRCTCSSTTLLPLRWADRCWRRAPTRCGRTTVEWHLSISPRPRRTMPTKGGKWRSRTWTCGRCSFPTRPRIHPSCGAAGATTTTLPSALSWSPSCTCWRCWPWW